MPVPPDVLREIFGRFATGVTIITIKNDDGLHGLTVNAFTSVSLDPPLILFCIQKHSASHSLFSKDLKFVVNFLSKAQRELSGRFASPDLTSTERFAGVRYRTTECGIPILRGSLGHLECQIVQRFGAGDHSIFLGRVLNTGITDENEPLLFYQSRYRVLPRSPE